MSLSWIQKPVKNPGKGLFLSPVCCVLKAVEGSARYKVMYLSHKHYTYHMSKMKKFDCMCILSQGDSGGPLVCKNIAVGIVSFHDSDCKSPKLPYVYTRISTFLPWINCILGNKE